MEMITAVKVGDLLRAWRERAGLTQEQFAEKTGISRGHIGDYECNRSSPKISSVLKIIAAVEKIYGPFGGAEEHEKLARFFRGPDYDDLLDRAARIGRDLVRLKKDPSR